MNKILTRNEFIEYFNGIQNGLGDATSPLWIPDPDAMIKYFVCLKQLRAEVSRERAIFWKWNSINLSGAVKCFSSNPDDNEEWWGFTQHDDIALFCLRWV